MAITDLTNQMKQLAESGAPDLQFSPAAHKKIKHLITTYRKALTEQRKNAEGLADYQDVGNFYSAKQTKWALQSDVTDQLLPTLDQYISYLDEFEKTVNAAFNRMQAEDQG